MKKILGITALFAVLVFALMFTTCDGLLAEKDDGQVRTVNFINNSAAKIAITCQGEPPYFELEAAADTNDDSKSRLVTRKGFDIVLTTITILKPQMVDPWNYIEVTGSAVPGNSKGKDGLALKAGVIKFSAVKNNGFIDYKIDTITQDE